MFKIVCLIRNKMTKITVLANIIHFNVLFTMLKHCIYFMLEILL